LKKILFIAAHRKGRSPGQRYRFEQYFDFLEQNELKCELSNLLNAEDDKVLYTKGNYFKKFLLALKSYKIRRNDLRRIKNNEFDLVVLYREAIITRSIRFEKRIAKTGIPLVFDFDDAIWVKDVSEGNKWLSFLKNASKINDILPLCTHVTSGNSYLANYALKYNKNVSIIPSTIDITKYVPMPMPSERITIGWVGSHTTVKHFEEVQGVYERIQEKYGEKIQFKVIGDPNYRNSKLNIIGEPWSNDYEVELFNSIDIGVMPLFNSDWTKGKCGMKGLLYMSVGKPAVMSAIGMNTEIIEHGVNGFIPKGEQEWFDVLCKLIEDKTLRENVGLKGRETVIDKYSYQANKEIYLKLYKSLILS